MSDSTELSKAICSLGYHRRMSGCVHTEMYAFSGNCPNLHGYIRSTTVNYMGRSERPGRFQPF